MFHYTCYPRHDLLAFSQRLSCSRKSYHWWQVGIMSQYEREYDYYQEVARLCSQRCETGLIQRGIRAMVTFRVKSYIRLKKKIEQRQSKKNYQSPLDIYRDIVDLAGVRIALYFPADREEVSKFIQTEFKVNNSKDKFPSESQASYKKRFSGYQAIHYHVQLQNEYLADHQKRYAKAGIEIQVASVLMHAWAEVEHDLVYKPFSGELSDE